MYNQDIGRWFAPDPYGQYHSPYLAMGNNPVSQIDPDGGYSMASPGGGRFWSGKAELDRDRQNGTGAFDYAHTNARYQDEYQNIRKHCLSSSYGNRQDLESYFNAVQSLNNMYYGLGGNLDYFTAETGQEGLTSSDLGIAEDAQEQVNDAILANEPAQQQKRSEMTDYVQKSQEETRNLHKNIQSAIKREAIFIVNAQLFALMNKVGGDSDPDVRTGIKLEETSSDGTQVISYYDNEGNLTNRITKSNGSMSSLFEHDKVYGSSIGGGLGESAPNSAFTMRGEEVNYKTLFNEFKTGTGPEYSGFGQNHPMTKDMQKSLIVTLAMTKYMAGGGKPLRNFDVPFGVMSIPLASQSMTEQFVGGARVSIFPTSIGTVFIVNNSTGWYSASYHTGSDIDRVSGQTTPYGTIYQRFMWITK
jgi:hypothetical protein